ncbi:hypothetical protein [Alteromonas sp. ASW11-130]|uniref:hypothetical protein n=1 Tax=Alteromonas sp. ASW11-130 TaxID=3015775 RepID=UPI002242664D|nr:hypothetical protein [Alteromonas sp. ASW11-130]MCW8092362.1 hypothetical protein [Alteromonas sp. ASW11-130]
MILINKPRPQEKVSNNLSSNGLGNHCQFVNSECEIVLGNQAFHLTLSTMPVIEERVELLIGSEQAFKLERAVIEGINMYMGTLPIIQEKVTAKKWRGWFMLGACSEPKMKWKMTLQFEGQPEPALLLFSTGS